MLVDTHKSFIATDEAQDNTDPAAYGRNIIVFRLSWEDNPAGDLMTFDEAVTFVTSFDDDTDDELGAEDARQMLRHSRCVHIGPNDDRYTLTQLAQPLRYCQATETLIPLDEWDDHMESLTESDELFDCRPGIDYPATL